MDNQNLYDFILQWADNSLILGQRLGEWCGHGPVLEQDIALINISLDLIGEAKNLYEYAGELSGKSEDEVAFLRYEHEYKNTLLVEQPNGHWGNTILRQLMFDTWHYHFLETMCNSNDSRLAAIAQKSLKESKYHLRFSSEWAKRLGDGTDVSHEKMQSALNDLMPYYDELFNKSSADVSTIDSGVFPFNSEFEANSRSKLSKVLAEATLSTPNEYVPKYGGKTGVHSEYMGYILTEMQYMQRAYPNMEW